MFHLLGLKENNTTESKSEVNETDANIHYDINSNSQCTVRTIESEKTEPIVIGKEKTQAKQQTTKLRESKSKQKESKRKKSLIQEQLYTSDKQKVNKSKSTNDSKNRDVYIKKLDKKRIKITSVEKSEEESYQSKPMDFQKEKYSDLSTSDSDTDSSKSLLCSLAPKWLSGNRNRKQVKKKSQDHQNQHNSAGKADKI